MTALYKAVRPDGTDFWTGAIQWLPPVGHEGEWIVHHPNGEREPGAHPRTFLSASTTPTGCVGMEWPCRLLTVEPVEGYPTARPDRGTFPHRVAAMAWRVTGERHPHEVFGPQGEHVVRLLDSLADARWDTINGDAAVGASDAAREATWGAVKMDAWDAAWYAASGAAWDAARGDARGDAADAAVALVARDLIPRETYDTLTRPVRLAGITVHPDDPDLTKED